jgi:hypothetical protein
MDIIDLMPSKLHSVEILIIRKDSSSWLAEYFCLKCVNSALTGIAGAAAVLSAIFVTRRGVPDLNDEI